MNWYKLVDTPIRVVKTNKDIVELRDLDEMPYVLPAAVVDKLPKLVAPKDGSVWRNKNSGDVFIYHDGNLHNPKLILRLSFFFKRPELWEEYGAPTGDDFADRIQKLMEEGSAPSLTFTRKSDGGIDVEYTMDEDSFNYEAPEYASGVDVEEALDNLEFQQNVSSDGQSVIL